MTRSLLFAGALALALANPPPATPALERTAPADDPDSGAALIGQAAPEWAFTRWVRGPARSLRDLRGRVVLVRWWTAGCRYCRSTLPAIEALRQRYGDSLAVIGVYHSKPEPREVGDRQILKLARELGFHQPIAFDRDWRTLDRYWLGGHPDRNWTSVSFLVDREGVIRWVHGGGEYHPSSDPRHRACDLEYRELERAIALALAPARPAP